MFLNLLIIILAQLVTLFRNNCRHGHTIVTWQVLAGGSWAIWGVATVHRHHANPAASKSLANPNTAVTWMTVDNTY